MNPAVRGLVSVVVACVLAAGSAVFAVHWLHDRRAEQVAAQAEPLKAEHRVDRVVNALAGLADDGVYVAPDARDLLSAKAERKLAQAVATSQTPVKVVVWSQTRFAGVSMFDLRQQLESGLGEDGASGVYLIWEGPQDGNVDTYGPRGGYVDMSPHQEFVGDPAVTLPRLVNRVDDDVTFYSARNSDSDYWGGTGGGIMAGVLIGLGVLLGVGCVYGVLVLITKRRLPGTWRW